MTDWKPDWRPYAVIALLGLLAFGVAAYLLVQNADTNARVQKIVVQRESDHREFEALLGALHRLGLKVPALKGGDAQTPTRHTHHHSAGQQPAPGQPGAPPAAHPQPSVPERVEGAVNEAPCTLNALGVRVCAN